MRIVSITPLPVEADSRTYKQATTFGRLGFESIVVEGQRSGLAGRNLPFALISPAGTDGATPAPADAVPAAQAMDTSPGVSARRRGALWSTARILPDRVRHSLPYRVAQWLYSEGAYQRLIARSLPAASLYVLHGHRLFPALYPVAARRRAPIIYDAHDLYWALGAEHERPALDERAIAGAYRLLERGLVATASARLTVGPRLAQIQEERFGHPFCVVRNAHDPRLDTDPGSTVRMASGAGPDDFLIVLIGNAKPSLAIEELLQALTRLPADVRLACVGRGYEAFASRTEALGLGDRVAFVGAVLPSEVTRFVRDADLAANVYYPASPNAMNALPNGFFQSVAAGLPLLYPRLPEIESIAEQYELGLPVDASRPDELVRQIEILRSSPELAGRFRANAIAAASDLTWEHEERVLASIVSDLGLAPDDTRVTG